MVQSCNKLQGYFKLNGYNVFHQKTAEGVPNSKFEVERSMFDVHFLPHWELDARLRGHDGD